MILSLLLALSPIMTDGVGPKTQTPLVQKKESKWVAFSSNVRSVSWILLDANYTKYSEGTWKVCWKSVSKQNGEYFLFRTEVNTQTLQHRLLEIHRYDKDGVCLQGPDLSLPEEWSNVVPDSVGANMVDILKMIEAEMKSLSTEKDPTRDI